MRTKQREKKDADARMHWPCPVTRDNETHKNSTDKEGTAFVARIAFCTRHTLCIAEQIFGMQNNERKLSQCFIVVGIQHGERSFFSLFFYFFFHRSIFVFRCTAHKQKRENACKQELD